MRKSILAIFLILTCFAFAIPQGVIKLHYPNKKGCCTAGFGDITDSFDRANSTSSLGVADSGQTWVPQVRTWGINSNQAYCVNCGSGFSAIEGMATINYGSPDAVIEVTFSTLATVGLGLCDVGIVTHFSVVGNFEVICYSTSIDRLRYFEYVGGINVAFMDLKDGIIVSSGDTMRVETKCNNLKVYINDVLEADVNTVARATTLAATNHGIYSQGLASRFNDFSVTACTLP